MWPSESQCVAACTGMLMASSEKRSLFVSSNRPAIASVPVASMVWIGFQRPPKRPLCGPCWFSGMPMAKTLPLRTSFAAATISSGPTWFSVPIWSSLPQRPQFESFSAAS